MDYNALAELLFPGVSSNMEELETKYPARSLEEGAKVTRMAPSPTGFMHLGNLFGAIADERLAHQSEGVFYLRIEDTDKKREIEGGVETILKVFSRYELPFDEGAALNDYNGAYGPYRQRERAAIYHMCTKWLIQQGKAYPCFLTEGELASAHEKQANSKENFGCYGVYAKYRKAALDEIKQRINEGQSYVIRFRSEGDIANRVKVTDLVRGKLELQENEQDVVVLKSDGIPTYHFAHVVDDHFMRTTHVVRGEEWLATLPIHLQLFAALGWRAPKYMHTAQLMKMDGGSKRKLSKRKDPELALDYYSEKGYTVTAVKEYLLSLLNSNFEEWRMANPDKDLNEFPFSIKKMGVSGALFDTNKLDDISKTVVSRMSAQTVYNLLNAWAGKYDEGFYDLLKRDEEYMLAALSIGRGGPKARKDITVWSEAKAYLNFFFDELFAPELDLPQNVDKQTGIEILKLYEQQYSPGDDQTAWFEGVKAVAEKIGFAANMKDYKANPEKYKGNVGDVSMVLRLAVTGRAQSPDLHDVMQILGEKKIKQRLINACKRLTNQNKTS